MDSAQVTKHNIGDKFLAVKKMKAVREGEKYFPKGTNTFVSLEKLQAVDIPVSDDLAMDACIYSILTL